MASIEPSLQQCTTCQEVLCTLLLEREQHSRVLDAYNLSSIRMKHLLEHLEKKINRLDTLNKQITASLPAKQTQALRKAKSWTK